MVHSESMAQPGSEHRSDPVLVYIVIFIPKEAGPYSKGWAILKKLRHTRVWRSWLGNTQNLGTSEFPKVFQNPFLRSWDQGQGQSGTTELNKITCIIQ